MRVPPTLSTVLGNLFKKPATNPPFPKSDPVPVPEGFRGGKLVYDVEKCVGCRLCITVCPAGVIEYVPPEVRKVTFWLGRCTFCAQCVDVCPVNALSMSDEFLLATADKYDDNLRWFHGGRRSRSSRGNSRRKRRPGNPSKKRRGKPWSPKVSSGRRFPCFYPVLIAVIRDVSGGDLLSHQFLISLQEGLVVLQLNVGELPVELPKFGVLHPLR